MSVPDFDELRAVGRELSRILDTNGALTHAEYERLLARARTAAAGFPLLEFIANFDPNPPRR